jgi:hypothetical protein
MKTESVINLLLGAAVAIGFVWTQLKSLPRMEDKVNTHEVRLTVMESKLGNIEEGVKFLVREKRRGRND